jgi:hypothetical protein
MAMRRKKVALVVLPDTERNHVDVLSCRPRIAIAAHHPDDVVEILVVLTQRLSVLHQSLGPVSHHLVDEAFVRTRISQIRRREEHNLAVLRGLADYPIRILEILLVRNGPIRHLRKGSLSVCILGGVLGELVFEQIDENGVEPFGLTILKIPRRFFFCQIRYQGPPCVAL